MGLEAVYQKPNLSQPNPEHRIYPYLLRHLTIERCNQVWSTDITYIRLTSGFVYLMAAILNLKPCYYSGLIRFKENDPTFSIARTKTIHNCESD